MQHVQLRTFTPLARMGDPLELMASETLTARLSDLSNLALGGFSPADRVRIRTEVAAIRRVLVDRGENATAVLMPWEMFGDVVATLRRYTAADLENSALDALTARLERLRAALDAYVVDGVLAQNAPLAPAELTGEIDATRAEIDRRAAARANIAAGIDETTAAAVFGTDPVSIRAALSARYAVERRCTTDAVRDVAGQLGQYDRALTFDGATDECAQYHRGNLADVALLEEHVARLRRIVEAHARLEGVTP